MLPTPLLTAITALLLAAGGGAIAATDYVPRMERVAHCTWDRPGHNPFTGDVVAAIDRYIDIPTPVRVKLKQRMQARSYDDLVDIRRDEISGRERYEPAIRDMHFGLDRVCRQVTRAGWSAQMHERGLVYCESGHCILVPTVCRNVSRVTRRPAVVAGESLDGTPAVDPAGDMPLTGLTAAAVPPTPITSSFAEAVAGASVPLWELGEPFTDPVSHAPPGSGGGGFPGIGAEGPDGETGSGPGSPGGPGGGGGGGVPGGPGGGGGGGVPGGPGGGSEPGGPGSGGDPDGGGWPGSGGGAPGGGLLPQVSPIPEPSTWASLLAGLAALAAVSARRRGRRPAAAR